MRNSRRSKQNSFLNGEWGGQKKWGKRYTSRMRRAQSKEIIKEQLSS